MTDTPTSTPTPTRKRWLIPTLVGVAVLLIGVTIGVAAANSSDDSSSTGNLNSSQVANVQRACQQWMGSYNGSAPSSDWCSGMASWMNHQWRSGQMMGSMMWGNSDRMRTACKQWADNSTSSSTSTPSGQQSWCDSMANWMNDHADGDWDGWMSGGMMGN